MVRIAMYDVRDCTPLFCVPATASGRCAAACIALLDRGYGKPAQPHTGEDGEGGIEIIIRKIIEEKPNGQAHIKGPQQDQDE
jgi:hypothetical protein